MDQMVIRKITKMNERIYELANAANKDIVYTFKLEEAKQLHELMEKFAELIVKECAVIASKAENSDAELRCMYDVITEHFGVK